MLRRIRARRPGRRRSSGDRPEGATAEAEASGRIDEEAARIVDRVSPLTMTGPARIAALVDAVRYCVDRRLEGGLCECGVWRGGSALAMILALQERGIEDRDLHLYDTFEGMTEPTVHDTSPFHPPAEELWQRSGGKPWAELFDGETNIADAVRSVLAGTGYPEARINLVRGPVEETLPERLPGPLALLRLDTDWYESTLHELRHLYPLLFEGGVLIIDDYGHWEGCRRAVDEYFATEAEPLLLTRIDYTARIAVKA
jgi:O-methyltransferase